MPDRQVNIQACPESHSPNAWCGAAISATGRPGMSTGTPLRNTCSIATVIIRQRVRAFAYLGSVYEVVLRLFTQ